jgi:hypothetical protein
MKKTTFEIEQFLKAMPNCQAKEEAIKKGKSILRHAWNNLRAQGYEPNRIGYVWRNTWDYDNAQCALAVTGYKPINSSRREKWYEIEEYHMPQK